MLPLGWVIGALFVLLVDALVGVMVSDIRGINGRVSSQIDGRALLRLWLALPLD